MAVRPVNGVRLLFILLVLLVAMASELQSSSECSYLSVTDSESMEASSHSKYTSYTSSSESAMETGTKSREDSETEFSSDGALSLSHRAAQSSQVEVNQKTKTAIMVRWLVFPNHCTRMLNSLC